MNLNYSKEELASIWYCLNVWKWDGRLGEKPKDWDSMPDWKFTDNHRNTTKRDVIKPIMEQIESKIGEKECMRWHHLNNLGSTNLKFEYWWFKDRLYKLVGMGFYSKKTKKKMRGLLQSIKTSNQERWIKDNYSNKI